MAAMGFSFPNRKGMHVRWGVSGSGCRVEAKPDPGVMLPGYPPWVGRKGKHDCKPHANNWLYWGEKGFLSGSVNAGNPLLSEDSPLLGVHGSGGQSTRLGIKGFGTVSHDFQRLQGILPPRGLSCLRDGHHIFPACLDRIPYGIRRRGLTGHVDVAIFLSRNYWQIGASP